MSLYDIPAVYLSTLLRLIFKDRGIGGVDGLSRRVKKTMTELGVKAELAGTQANNTLKRYTDALRNRSPLTANSFGWAVHNLLKLEITAMSITVRDPATGLETTYHTAMSDLPKIGEPVYFPATADIDPSPPA